MRALRGVFGVVVLVACLLVVGGSGVAAPSGFGLEGEEAGQLADPEGVAVEQESGDVYIADKGNGRVDKFSGEGAFMFAWGWGVADGHTNALQTCTTVCLAGAAGAGAGQFNFLQGVAVDNDPLSASYRDVYVLDTGNARVEKFDSEGHFLLMFGGEVNETTKANVCLAGEACEAGVPGTEPGEFTPANGHIIAVDAAGTVYVGDRNRVQEFSPGGVYTGQVTLAGAGRTEALAVDSGGDVYVESSERSGVRKYDSSGTELGEPRDAAGEPSAITLGAFGELFVDDGRADASHHILAFDPSGNEVASFDPGAEGGSGGIAFGNGVGELYVLTQGRVRLVSPPPPGPLVVAQSAGESQPTTAIVNATIDTENHATSYHVEYGTSVSYGSSTPSAALAAGGFEEEAVGVALSGLQPRTTYHFRVVAGSSAGMTAGPDETFTTLPPVSIDSESVSGVTAKSATLAARLNPLGRDTRYRFEYGPTAAYGTNVPVPDGDAGAGTADVLLSALVEGLSPNTVYHYRVVAYNSYNTPGTVVEGPDHVFTTQSGEAPGLPDGRAWEMVSPPNKRGISLDAITENGGLIQASVDGGAITYVALGPIDAEPKGNRSFTFTQILSKRDAAGWSSADIATPHEAVVGLNVELLDEYRIFSPDLSVGMVEPEGATPLSPQASEQTPYRREANGEYTPLLTAANVPPGTKFGGVEVRPGDFVNSRMYAGGTPDLSHVILQSPFALTAGIVNTGQPNLFEWSNGSLRLVSILPNGKPATEEMAIASLGYQNDNVRHAVSDDGSRIFWETFGVQGHLYMRDMNRGETVQLDALRPGARGGNSVPVFATASSDGSKVFFTDVSRLTSDSTARGAEPDLYMCEIGEAAGKLGCVLRDLTVDHNRGESANVQFATVIGAGEDGRYAYFVANGVLAEGATPGDCNESELNSESESGLVCNLYVHDSVAGETRFVAALADGDFHDWLGVGGRDLGNLTSGVSPNGRYLAFMSQRSLTGYDNIDARSGQPDVEVFLYDAGSGRLVCASCNPSGARPSGVFDPGVYPGLLVDRPKNWGGHWLAGSIPGWTLSEYLSALHRSRYLSDSGRLFFNSADALVPRDANGVEDVYEYEPAGVGGCRGGTGSDCVGLVSSGTSGEESAFLDASESGNDVFFLTASQLVPQDLDGALDVYDARVCSASSPCLTGGGAQSPPCATADGCRAAPSSQPGVFGAPPSATFSGAGNLAQGISKPVVKRRTLTVARRLAVALRKCRAKPKRRRASCEAHARRAYRVGVTAKRSRAASATSKGNR